MPVESKMLEIQEVTRKLRQLEMANEDTARFFDLGLDLHVIVSRESILRVNRACTDNLGWTSEDLIGKHWSQFIHTDDIAPTEAVVKRMENEAILEFCNRWRVKDSEQYKVICWRVTPWDERGLAYSSGRVRQIQNEA